MEQIKKFKKGTSETIINKFLSENNGTIISFDPIVIKYTLDEVFDNPLMEYTNIPKFFSFCLWAKSGDKNTSGRNLNWENVEFRCGRVLFFENYIIFITGKETHIKLDLDYNMLFDEKGKEQGSIYHSKELNKNFYTNLECFEIGLETYYTDIDSDDSVDQLRDRLIDEGFVTTNFSHLYNTRTNALVSIENVKARISASQVQATHAIAAATAGGERGLEEFYDPKLKRERLGKERVRNWQMKNQTYCGDIDNNNLPLRTELQLLAQAGAKSIEISDSGVVISI